MPIIPHPVHCLVHILKMAAQEMAGLGSEDLLLDDKWLSSILGEEEQSVQVDKEEKPAVDKVDKEDTRMKEMEGMRKIARSTLTRLTRRRRGGRRWKE